MDAPKQRPFIHQNRKFPLGCPRKKLGKWLLNPPFTFSGGVDTLVEKKRSTNHGEQLPGKCFNFCPDGFVPKPQDGKTLPACKMMQNGALINDLRNTVTGVKETTWSCNFPPTYKGGVEWLPTKVWHEVVSLQNQPRLWIGHGYWEFPIEMLFPQKRWSKNQHNLSRLKRWIFETFWMKAPPPGTIAALKYSF